MWQNLIVLAVIAVASVYVFWNIYRGITAAAENAGSCGGGCGSCGCKSGNTGNLIQLSAEPTQSDDRAEETTASEEHPAAVSSQ